VTQQTGSTFVLRNPSEIVQALVALKEVRVLHYSRSGSHVELMIEQVVEAVRCGLSSFPGHSPLSAQPIERIGKGRIGLQRAW
jgi:hypothetical protein